jgi:hypothetical protein
MAIAAAAVHTLADARASRAFCRREFTIWMSKAFG